MEVGEFGAVVLSGGGAVRLGGADKATIEIGGRTLLERTLAALADAGEVVVVGSEVPTSRPVTFTREDPPGGGPAAGLFAGLRRFARPPGLVVVLAVDMPLVSTGTVRRLVDAAVDPLHDATDGAVLVDVRGVAQPLCAAYRTASLERAFRDADADEGRDLAMRRLVAVLRLTDVSADGDESRDVDSWQDLADLRETLAD